MVHFFSCFKGKKNKKANIIHDVRKSRIRGNFYETHSWFFNGIMQRYLPDPFLFVIILTFAVFGFGLIFTDSTSINLVQYWGEGFWGLLAFSMQMILVLVTGHVLASSPLCKKD